MSLHTGKIEFPTPDSIGGLWEGYKESAFLENPRCQLLLAFPRPTHRAGGRELDFSRVQGHQTEACEKGRGPKLIFSTCLLRGKPHCQTVQKMVKIFTVFPLKILQGLHPGAANQFYLKNNCIPQLLLFTDQEKVKK